MKLCRDPEVKGVSPKDAETRGEAVSVRGAAERRRMGTGRALCRLQAFLAYRIR